MKIPPSFRLLLTLLLLSAAVRAQAPAAPAPAATAAEAHAQWEKEIAAFERADRESPPAKGGVLFIGSSSIRMWTTLAADFPGHRVVNRGFGGSQIADSTRFAERVIFPHEPRLIVLYAGGNDLNSSKTPEQVFADLQAFVAKVRARLPEAEIAYISIAGNPARWGQVEKVKAVNARAEALAKETPRMKFINVFPRMLGPDGLPRPDIFLPDRLHMNAEGYKLWTEIVRPFLG